jgi:predicted AlkP superfamily pyrophosphatase or phosphodiesterase
VTCSVQATYLTGVVPSVHGIVGNGWYFRDENEVKFWRQSNSLVQSQKIWETARAIDPGFTCANMFWWFNMYSSADYAVTPRPMYPADGRKIPDVWTNPPELRRELQDELGQFPLFNFWGPNTTLGATEWISRSTMRVSERFNPTLTLVYLPHLDYELQRVGPEGATTAKHVGEVDGVCEELVTHFEKRGTHVIVLSEYGITSVRRPVSLNRTLRKHGFITVREELGREILDAGASRAFVVADHQLGHVYVRDSDDLPAVRTLLEDHNGVDCVLEGRLQRAAGLSHERAGDLVVLAEADSWFTYYFWMDDDRAPDYARTVDIHRKPGYDPAELFVDPTLKAPMAKVGLRVLQKKLGFRYLMDVIPLDASLVGGSHGRLPDVPEHGPMLISRQTDLLRSGHIHATAVHDIILNHLRARR